ncbi:armadillo-type protein [Dissophora ornata]|nr:armadillo-type protein [Dissophora ornata]
MELDEDTDVVQLLANPSLSAVEKAQLLSQSQYDFHRSFLAREMPTLLVQMKPNRAISHLIPIIRDFSLDTMDPVRESLASQLDKIVLYFYQNSIIANNTKGPVLMGDYSEDYEDNDPLQDEQDPGPPPPLLHDVFTPVFMNLLLDQNAGIAHQTRIAIDAVAQSVPDEILESEILNGVITGLEKLYTPEKQDDQENEDDVENGGGLYSRDEQDGEAELGKMLVVVLLTALAPLLGAERCTCIVVPRLEMFTHNSQFYVRKEIVMALGALCKIVSQDVVVNRLLPLYDVFVQDDTWHIRRACCTILASFIGSLPAEMKADKVEEIYGIFSVDVSRSVRNSIMEVLGEVIAGFEKENVPDSLLNHFLNMGQQPMNEHERAVMCAFSFPAVVLTAGPSKWELMKPVYMQLAGTFRSPIRRSLACSLHEVARILGPELADRDLALAFADCLLAEDEVKEGVLGHVVEFVSCLSTKCRSEALHDLYRAWIDLERSSNWRLRDSLAGHLPALCEIAEGRDLLQVLMPLSVKACTDGVSTIRESGVMSFPALWEASKRVGAIPTSKAPSDNADNHDFPMLHDDDEEDMTLNDARPLFDPSQGHELEDIEIEDVCGDFTNGSKESDNHPGQRPGAANTEPASVLVQSMTTIKEEIIRQTTDFAINGGFRSRVVAVQIIQSLIDYGIPVEEFEKHFMSLLADRLANDSVVNIRIWVARVVTWIIDSGYYGDKSISPRLRELLTSLQQDPDRDVRIYSGGHAELPTSKKTERQCALKGGRKKMPTTKTLSVFHQNPKNGEVAAMEDDEETEVHLMFDGEEHDDSDDDDDEEDEEEEEEEEEENRSSYDGSEEAKESANDSGFYVPSDMEDKPYGDKHGQRSLEQEDTALVSNAIDEKADNDYGDEEEDEEDRVADQVVPYTTFSVNGASPLDVEMEDSFEEDSFEEESFDEDSFEEESITDKTEGHQEPDEPPITAIFEPTGPSATAFPPLSPSSPPPVTTRLPLATLSYAASVKSVKYGEDSKAKALSSNLTSMTSFTQANIPEPPHPSSIRSAEEQVLQVLSAKLAVHTKPSPRSSSPPNSKEANIFAEPLSPSFPSLCASSSSSSASTPSSSPSMSASSSAASSASSSPASSPLPFSYAAVVASGAAVAATSRVFSPPMSPPLGTSAAMTF